jgi:uncharacterized protein (TIGR00106 family)
MRATAEIQIIPLGVGVSVRKEVQRARQILTGCGLLLEPHAYGTNVEGELADILAAIQQLHEVLHREGVVRLTSAIKIGTRTPSLAGKGM